MTMVEILVVVAILALLTGILVPAVMLLRKRQMQISTAKLLVNIGSAIDAYLERWPLLEPGFADRPWLHLNRRLVAAGEIPVLESTGAGVLREEVSGVWVRAGIHDGEAMRDHFRGEPADTRLRWTVVARPTASPRYTETVLIRSVAGTPADPRDDIVYALTLDPEAVRVDAAALGLDGFDLRTLRERQWVMLTR